MRSTSVPIISASEGQHQCTHRRCRSLKAPGSPREAGGGSTDAVLPCASTRTANCAPLRRSRSFASVVMVGQSVCVVICVKRRSWSPTFVAVSSGKRRHSPLQTLLENSLDSTAFTRLTGMSCTGGHLPPLPTAQGYPGRYSRSDSAKAGAMRVSRKLMLSEYTEMYVLWCHSTVTPVAADSACRGSRMSIRSSACPASRGSGSRTSVGTLGETQEADHIIPLLLALAKPEVEKCCSEMESGDEQGLGNLANGIELVRIRKSDVLSCQER